MSSPLGERLRRLAPDLLWVTAGQAAAVLGAFGGVKLLTSLLAPEAYGELALGNALAGAGSLLVFGPLASAHVRLFSAAQERGELALHVHGLGRLLRQAVVAVLCATALGCAAAALAAGPRWALIGACAGLSACAGGASLFQASYGTAQLARRRVAGWQAADALGRPLFASAAVLLLGASGAAALAGVAAAQALVFLWERARVRRDPALRAAIDAPAPSREAQARLLAEAADYALPLSLGAVAAAFAQYADRWTLQGLLGPAAVGTYAALVQVGNGPTALLGGVATAFVVPLAFRRAGAGADPSRLRSGLRALELTALLVALPAGLYTALCALAGELLLRLLATPAYAREHRLLWIFAAAGGLFAAGQTLIGSGLVARRTRLTLVPWAVNGAATLGLSLLLGRRMGLPGVAWALLASNGLHALSALWVARRLARESAA